MMPKEFTMGRFNPICRCFSLSYLGRLTRPTVYIFFIAVALAMWFRFLDFPSVVGGVEGDSDGSWNQSYAYFLKNQFQAGKDYLFTCGPLGYFQNGMVYDSELFWYKYAWELVVKSVLVIAIMRFARHLPGFLAKLAFCLLAFTLIPLAEYFFPLLLIGVITVKENRSSVLYLAAVTLFLAVISLVKFTYFTYSVPVVCLIALSMLGNKHRWAALWPLALFATAFTLIWVGLGQSLGNLPHFLFGSLQISAGYAEAMSIEGNPTEVYCALLILVTFWATLLPFSARDLPALRCLGNLRQLCLVGLLGLTAFSEWKHGFISQGGICVVFFSLFLLTPFLLPALFTDYDWRAVPRVRLLAACFSLSLAGITVFGNGIDWITFIPSLPVSVIDNARLVLDPSRLKRDLDHQQAEAAEAIQLPLIRARVGRASVDVISVEQSVLLLNKLNWRPRPVFQSHAAYTPYLQSANAEFFRTENAPQYVIFRLEPIRERFPTLDEGQALLEILQCYRPVLAEKGYLLLERYRGPSESGGLTGEVVLEKKVKFDEVVDLNGLPGKYHTLAVKIRRSWWGRLRNFLYKPPQVNILVSTGPDQEPHTYRFIPSMAEGGFILNPWLEGPYEDILNLYDYDHPTGKMITWFCITTGGPESYEDEIEVTIKTFPRLVGAGLDPAVLVQVQYPVMRTPFVRATAHEPVTVETYAGKNVLRVHAPSAVEFDVPSRSRPRRIAGKFGILPDAYANPDDSTDGVQFAVEYTAGGGSPQVLFEKFLDPHNQPRDQGMQDFAVWLPPGETGTVVLKAFKPPGKNEHLDWAFWADVEIESAEPTPEGQPPAGGKGSSYEELVRQVRAAVAAAVPNGATVAVVSKGDDDLIRLPGRTGWHFPQQPDGSYLGYNPERDQAVALLEAVRAKGGRYLVFPRPAFWWLDHYRALQQHLDGHYQRVHSGDHCIIYRLSVFHLSDPTKGTAPPQPGSKTDPGFLEEANGESISGWAWDKQEPNKPIEVDIYDGDRLLATARADGTRDDLAQAGKGDGKHGFCYPTPAGLKDGKEHTIHVRTHGTDLELLGSPRTLKAP
jgi:hypothetical protein